MVYLLIVALSCLAVLQTAEAIRKRSWRFAVIDGDEDIKIAAPGSYPKATEDAGSLEAKRYLKLKQDGSIEKARALGSKYAAMLLEAKAALQGCENVNDPLCEHQQLVLYSYAINRAISELCSNSMLAQTSLNVFYDEIEEVSPDLHRHISDMAAFSLYILCERSNGRTQDEIGKVYARLCDAEGHQDIIKEGNDMYNRFYAMCAEEFSKIGLAES